MTMTNWQPMELAPTNGERVLLCIPNLEPADQGIVIGRWHNGTWVSDAFAPFFRQPAGWQRLPEVL